MKNFLRQAGLPLLCLILVLTTCYGIPSWQAVAGKPLSDSFSAQSGSAEERFRKVNYEKERLNRLIEYGNSEDIEHWEQQKAALEPYQAEMQME